MISDDGSFEFELDQLDRTKMIYREGSYVTKFDVEMLTNGLAIVKRSIVRWAAPHEDELLCAEDQKRIIANISSILKEIGEKVIID